MFKKYGKPKIEFLSNIPYLKDIEEIQPKPSVKFLPEWWKSMPYNTDIDKNIIESGKGLARACPSFPDYFSNGFILPMWADTMLYFNSKTGEWKGRCGNHSYSTFKINYFQPESFQDYGQTFLRGQKSVAVFQFLNPWTIVTSPGYYLLQLPLLFHENQDFSAFPGAYDAHKVSTDKLEIALYTADKEIFIKKGTPLVQYIPYKKERFDLIVRDKNKKDIEFETKKQVLKSVSFGLTYNQLKGKVDTDLDL